MAAGVVKVKTPWAVVFSTYLVQLAIIIGVGGVLDADGWLEASVLAGGVALAAVMGYIRGVLRSSPE